MMSPEELKDVGVATIGQRLAILKAVYQVKLAHNVPIDADHYVPPCA
jgi:protein STE50